MPCIWIDTSASTKWLKDWGGKSSRLQAVRLAVYCNYLSNKTKQKNQKLKETIHFIWPTLNKLLRSMFSTKETSFFAHKILCIKITTSTLYMNFLNRMYLFMSIKPFKLPQNSNNTPNIKCIRVIIRGVYTTRWPIGPA